MNLHDWIDELSDVLDVDAEVDEGLLADLTKVAAHSVEHMAAPVTAYLLGYAAASHAANPEQVERLAAKAQSAGRGLGPTGDGTGPRRHRRRGPRRQPRRPHRRALRGLSPTRHLTRLAACVLWWPTEAGGPEVLTIVERPDPEPGPGEVVLEVAAAGLNRADLLQRQGFYPPPPGASDILGMECSGTVAAVGDDVTGWQVGDTGCALLSAGAYATKVALPAGQLMPIPDGVDLVTAAALPEVACTVWSNVFMVAGLRPDETLLVHGGAGGIGTFAIQLATALGARVFTTAGYAGEARPGAASSAPRSRSTTATRTSSRW